MVAIAGCGKVKIDHAHLDRYNDRARGQRRRVQAVQTVIRTNIEHKRTSALVSGPEHG